MGARLVIRLAVASALASVGCMPPPHVVQQSTLAPVPTVVLPPSFEGFAEASLGDSTLLYLRPPELAPNAGAALYLPRTQVEGSLSIRVARRVRVRVPYLVAPSSGAVAAAPTTLDSPGATAWGVGSGVAVRAGGFGEPWNVDFVADTSLLSIPTYMQDEGVPGSGRVRYSALPQLAITVSPGYVIAPGTRLFVVATLRNHVTNAAAFTTSLSDPSPRVSAGPFYLPVGVGVEFRPVCGLSITPVFQWPLGSSPVEYGPVLSLTVRGSLPSEPVGRGRPWAPCPNPW